MSVDDLLREGALYAFDAAFARLLDRLAGGVDPVVAVVAALASRAVSEGNVCLELDSIAETTLATGERLPALDQVRALLHTCPLVGAPGDLAPLVLDASDRLYLHRYWQYEATLAERLLAIANGPVPGVDRAMLERDLARWFPAPEMAGQRRAAQRAVEHALCVISGGPGTGKTTTVGRCIALLLAQHGPAYRVRLAAPTGKAAARLQEALGQLRASLALGSELDAAYPTEVSTLHRLLGARPGSVYFRHGRSLPLAADCVIVDEASMVDLALAAKLVDALAPGTRLILLGDKDQLASVEAGAVLASLAAPATRVADCVALLEHSYRFDSTGGVGRLAAAIRAGDREAVIAALDAGDVAPATPREVVAAAVAGYREYMHIVGSRGDVDPAVAFAAFNRFSVLAPLRHGPHGVEALNRALGAVIGGPRAADWYVGRAVMITVNDYALRLFNGDVGLALAVPGRGGELRVFFEDPAGGWRSFAPTRLPACEDAFALTVHKSQGSEFDSVLLVVPDERPLTRELLYTAVTRAARHVAIRGSREAFAAGVARSQRRSSGLVDQLR